MNLGSLIKKGGLASFFLSICIQSSAFANAEVRQNQRVFEEGVAALFNGDYSSAQFIFEKLYAQTQAVRVKLEWARAAFLAKNYNLAQKLFSEVLELSELPDIVRFNISLFLNEISKLSDFTDYRISIVRDNNPFGVPSPQKVTILGIPFDFAPPNRRKTLSGLNLYLYHSKSISGDGATRLLLELDGIQYEGSRTSKLASKIAIETRVRREDGVSYRIGYDLYQQQDRTLLEQPFFSAIYRKNYLAGVINRLQVDVRHAKNSFPDFSFANSITNSLSVSASKNLGDSVQLTAGAYIDRNSAHADTQDYRTKGLSFGFRVLVPSISSTAQISLARSEREFERLDDLFVIYRSDKREFVSVIVQPYAKKIFGLYPSLEIGRETSNSSIPIYSFKKDIINFGLRRRY